MLGEEQALLFGQGGLQVARPADQPSLALLAHAAAEQRLDEHLAVPIDQVLDLVFRRAGAQHFRRGEVDVPEELGSV